jgi:hypothetical protein
LWNLASTLHLYIPYWVFATLRVVVFYLFPAVAVAQNDIQTTFAML